MDSMANIIRERAKTHCRALGARLREVEKSELANFRAYMEAAEDYPPPGWNRSFRAMMECIRTEMDEVAADAVTMVDRGTYLERLAFNDEEMRKRLNAFWQEVWETEGPKEQPTWIKDPSSGPPLPAEPPKHTMIA